MLNPIYLKEETIKQIKNKLSENPVLSLAEFFDKGFIEKLSENVEFIEDKKPMSHNYSTAEFDVSVLGDLKRYLENFDITFSKGKLIKLTHKSYELRNENKENEIIIVIESEFDENMGGKPAYIFKETFYLPTDKNNITIKKGNSERFIKYANHYAKNKHLTLLVLN